MRHELSARYGIMLYDEELLWHQFYGTTEDMETFQAKRRKGWNERLGRVFVEKLNELYK